MSQDPALVQQEAEQVLARIAKTIANCPPPTHGYGCCHDMEPFTDPPPADCTCEPEEQICKHCVEREKDASVIRRLLAALTAAEQREQELKKELQARVVSVPGSEHGDLPQRATGDKR